jgi:hypothetical protein
MMRSLLVVGKSQPKFKASAPDATFTQNIRANGREWQLLRGR